MADYTMKMVKLPMKATGRTMSFTDKGEFLMIAQKN